ncbi:hypothetical protein ACFLV9_00205 [Chloroflexota bacterium]
MDNGSTRIISPDSSQETASTNIRHSRIWLTAVIAGIIFTSLVVLFNIPFLRQSLGFLYLTFLPGILILLALKLGNLGLSEKFLYSVGLSIVFVMFSGAAISQLGSMMGYDSPLSASSLIICFSPILIVLAIIGYKRTRPTLIMPNPKFDLREKLFLILPSLFPLLSISGMYLMNTRSNNNLLMFLLFLIPAYVIFISIRHKKVPDRVFPLVILLISISLVLLLGMRGTHIIGVDTHEEYYVYQSTLSSLYWNPGIGDNISGSLAISLLPTAYQSILNIEPEMVFKLLYPVLISVLPLVVYILARKYIGNLHAFLASFLFVAQFNFLFTAYQARTNMAILFFALILMVLFQNRTGKINKMLFLFIFVMGATASHYTSTLIICCMLFLCLIGTLILRKMGAAKEDAVSLIGVLGFLLAVFVIWYGLIAQGPLDTIVENIRHLGAMIGQFFTGGIKGPGQATILGIGMTDEFPYKLQFWLTWTSYIIMAIGILYTFIKYVFALIKKNSYHLPSFLNSEFGSMYFSVTAASGLMIVSFIIIPFMVYSLTRTALLTLVVLAVFFPVGSIILSKYLRIPSYSLSLIVLIPFILCTTGVMYQIFGDPHNIILNSRGDMYELYYVHDQDSQAAVWLSDQIRGNSEVTPYYADVPGYIFLSSQGGILVKPISSHYLEKARKYRDGYVFLRCTNVIEKKVYLESDVESMDEWLDVLEGRDKVYSNGCSEIYR